MYEKALMHQRHLLIYFLFVSLQVSDSEKLLLTFDLMKTLCAF